MTSKKPIKRHPSIQPLSRDHHHGLLLCWKIRQGFAKGVSTDRIKTYIDWFYPKYIKPHFAMEESYLFPILGTEHPMVQQALEEHRELLTLFEEIDSSSESLSAIETTLEQHIRFEERVLFNKIQEVASRTDLELLEKHHSDAAFVENSEDEFWK